MNAGNVQKDIPVVLWFISMLAQDPKMYTGKVVLQYVKDCQEHTPEWNAPALRNHPLLSKALAAIEQLCRVNYKSHEWLDKKNKEEYCSQVCFLLLSIIGFTCFPLNVTRCL